MFNNIKKIIELFDDGCRKKTIRLFLLMLLSATGDMLGIFSIMPFLAVVVNQDLIENNKNLKYIYEYFGFESNIYFLLAMGLVVFCVFLLSVSVKAIATHYQYNFVMMFEYELSKRLLNLYIGQPYEDVIQRNSSEYIKNIISEAQSIASNSVLPMIILISQGLAAITLISLLLLIDPLSTLFMGSFLSASYFIIFKKINQNVKKIGKERFLCNETRFLTVTEAFSAVKEIKLYALEKVYTERYATSAFKYSMNQAKIQTIGQMPRFLLESISFGGILLLILIFLARGGGLTEFIPILALYAFAGYRLMPALQSIYWGITQLTFSSLSIDVLHDDLKSIKINNSESNIDKKNIDLKNTLKFKSVYFKYKGARSYALRDISFVIPAGSRVGIVGETGAGKTTIVDILLGLLDPDRGGIYIDDVLLDKSNRSDWQKNVGYIPQSICLIDDTIEANIAFGVKREEIDYASVIRAAKLASIHEHIVSMKDGYATVVGESGVKLSGGQRQRIGIARALYHSPKILVMDEATSALDTVTESEVMNSIYQISNEVTIIIIAHRISTIQRCDSIILIDKSGRIYQGTYDDLKDKSAYFKKIDGN